MKHHGVRFQRAITGTLHLSATNAFFLGGGKTMINALYRNAEKLGIHIRYDDDCKTSGPTPPKTHWAQKIDRPPFYGYPLRPGITFTYFGVTMNKQSAVIMNNGEPAKNIYAAGEIMSGNILPKGYIGGFGLVIGNTFGRIAGKEAAAFARNMSNACLETCNNYIKRAVDTWRTFNEDL